MTEATSIFRALEDLHHFANVHPSQLLTLLDQQVVREHNLLHHLRCLQRSWSHYHLLVGVESTLPCRRSESRA